jgi:hypothetical protein
VPRKLELNLIRTVVPVAPFAPQGLVGISRLARDFIKSSFPPISTALHHSAALLSSAAAGRFAIPVAAAFVQSFSPAKNSVDRAPEPPDEIFLWIKIPDVPRKKPS